MTIICYKDGELAADTAIWAGDVVCGHIRKVVKTAGGFLVGGAGDANALQRIHDFVERRGKNGDLNLASFKIEDGEDLEAFVVNPDGSLTLVEKGGLIKRISGQCFAMGAACEMAIGAMMAGATAKRAVAICIENHMKASGRIDVVSIH